MANDSPAPSPPDAGVDRMTDAEFEAPGWWSDDDTVPLLKECRRAREEARGLREENAELVRLLKGILFADMTDRPEDRNRISGEASMYLLKRDRALRAMKEKP